MRVLGVDPGLTRCGLGVIEGEPGRALTLIGTDVIRTPSGDEIGARLLALEEELDRWLVRYQPDAVAVERVFSQHNVRTVMGTAQAGAVAIVCAARRGVPVALHTPSEVKAAVTGSGRADKQQVTQMVTRLLRLTDPPRPADSADALALAICHLWRGTAQQRLAAARLSAVEPGAASSRRRQALAAARRRATGRRQALRCRARRGAACRYQTGRREARCRRSRMIAHLGGCVVAVAPEGAVIEVGGVGLLVQCTPGTLAGLRLGEHARLATSLVVREDALTLYGFASDDERNTFELLQTASGVGPRLAQAMLAVLTPDALRRAVAGEDLATLTSVPGIGRKGAQRIVLELAGRLGAPVDIGVPAAPGRGAPAAPQWQDQVKAGLVSLGWQSREADQAILAVEPDLTAAAEPGDVDVAVALRAALRALGRP